MTRSKKKTPIRGWKTATSDKSYKQYVSRRHRHATNQALRTTGDEAGLQELCKFGHSTKRPKVVKSWFDADDEPKSMRK